MTSSYSEGDNGAKSGIIVSVTTSIFTLGKNLAEGIEADGVAAAVDLGYEASKAYIKCNQ